MTNLLWFTIFCLLRLVLMDFPGSSSDPNKYGPYSVRLNGYATCRGPKSKNLTKYSVKIRRDNNDCKLLINVTSQIATRINEIKTYIYLVKDQSPKNLVFNFKLDNPCQHYGFGHLLQEQFGAKNCYVNKREYYSVINLKDIAFRFFGGSFFYGEFLVKSIFLAREGNIACFSVIYEFLKKEN